MGNSEDGVLGKELHNTGCPDTTVEIEQSSSSKNKHEKGSAFCQNKLIKHATTGKACAYMHYL